MFDIGWSELLVIVIVALVFVGPKELPVLMRTIGAFIHKMKTTAGQFQQQFQTALDEGEVKELKSSLEEVSETFAPHNLMGDLEESQSDMQRFEEDQWNEAVLSSNGENSYLYEDEFDDAPPGLKHEFMPEEPLETSEARSEPLSDQKQLKDKGPSEND